MKNERRNTKAKTANQNTEHVWSTPVKNGYHEYVVTWTRQKNQSVPQRKKRRASAGTRHPRHSPARDVLGTKGKADETRERAIGISYSPRKVGRIVTNTKRWVTDPWCSWWPMYTRLDRWKAWTRGEFNLVGGLRSLMGPTLLRVNPPAGRTPARAPLVG